MANRRSRSTVPSVLLSLSLITASTVGAAESAERGPFAAETVVGRVGHDELTLGDLLFRFASLPPAQRDRYLAAGGLEAFLDDTLAALATARAAAAAGVESDPLFPRLLELHREQLLADLHARRTVLQAIDEEALRSRYEAQKEARFRSPPRVHLRYLLVTAVAEDPVPNERGDDAVGALEAGRKIARLAKRIEAGESLERLARQHSEDQSARRGGDIGWVEAEELAPALAKAVAALEVGEVSGVVESSLGWHLIELLERRDGGLVPFAVVRELLYQEMVGERWLELAERAREESRRRLEALDVERFPERLP